MSPSDDRTRAEASSRSTPTPDGLTNSVRAEIAAFFGGTAAAPKADRERDRGGHAQLIADLENRILESMREAAEPPPELGPFVLEERIGRGGFAVVYRATHKRTGARAAVKVVPAADPESHRRVMTEVGSLAGVRHPNIVKIIDTGDEDGFAWIATEYVPGQTLADYIREHRPAPDSFQIADAVAGENRRPAAKRGIDPAALRMTIGWFRDLALALDALHATGLVHRDVKPANIVLDHDRRPFLIDFGLSSSAESTVSGLLAGTVPYMSPEQTLGGYVVLTPRSDVYSLAATFHEVLTGERVTRGVRRENILHQIAFVPVAPPSQVSPAVPASLDPIFRKALEKDSNQRYASARQLAEDLDSWLAHRTLAHVKEPLRTRFARKLRRHPIGAALSGVLLVVALAWGAFAIVTREQEYRDLLVQARTARANGDPLAALATLSAGAPKFGEREIYRNEYRLAALDGGPALARKLLATQAFAAVGLANRSDHARLAAEAESHLAHSGEEEPNLILVSALSKHVSKKPAEARAVLDRHAQATARSRSLTELDAIVALSQKDLAAHAAAVGRLRSLPSADLTATELCLRAWRQLYCLRGPDFPDPTPAEVDQLESDIGRVLQDQPDHALARSLLGMLKLERKDYRGAKVAFDELVKRPGGDSDRAGSLLMHAATGMLVAGNAAPDEKNALLLTAANYAKDAIAMDPGLMDWFLDQLVAAEWDVRARWIMEATKPWDRGPELGAGFLTFATMTIAAAPAGHDPSEIAGLCEAVALRYGSRLDPALTPDYVSVHTIHLWALLEQANAAMVAGRTAEARDLWTKARKLFEETRERVGELPYVVHAIDALSASFLAEFEADLPRKTTLRKEAIPLLRAVTTAALLDDALKKAPNPEVAKNIRWMYDRCLAQLHKLEENDEANSRGL